MDGTAFHAVVLDDWEWSVALRAHEPTAAGLAATLQAFFGEHGDAPGRWRVLAFRGEALRVSPAPHRLLENPEPGGPPLPLGAPTPEPAWLDLLAGDDDFAPGTPLGADADAAGPPEGEEEGTSGAGADDLF